MLSEALPLTSVTVPRAVAPSLNVTVPVGTLAAEVTVALRVTACPVVDGFGVEVRLVDVAAGGRAVPNFLAAGGMVGGESALSVLRSGGCVPTTGPAAGLDAA